MDSIMVLKADYYIDNNESVDNVDSANIHLPSMFAGGGGDDESCIIVSTGAVFPGQIHEVPEGTSADSGWEINKILGIDFMDGKTYYLVEWKSSLVLKSELDAIRAQGEVDGEPEKRVVDGAVRYLVRWKPSLIPEDEVDAAELIRDFQVRLKSLEDK
jgi:hypothetical protein